MNPPLTFDQALAQLKILTSQTANFTFTDAELTQALQSAWNNTYVCTAAWDNSTTYTPGVWQYAIPDAVTAVTDVYYQQSSSDFPERLSPDLYEVVGGNIQLNTNAQRWLGDTTTLFIKGRYKLQTTDLLETDNLVNYVISLAGYTLLKMLSYKHTFLFLKNDTSMADIINARRDMQADVLTYKQALQRSFESV